MWSTVRTEIYGQPHCGEPHLSCETVIVLEILVIPVCFVGAGLLGFRLAKVPLVGRPFRAENGRVAVRVTSLFLWSFEAVV
jgi:hypothetical protein